MSRLYRAALPEDYVHNPETGLWELSFDQRPVAGTRAASPEEGAAQYNVRIPMIPVSDSGDFDRASRAGYFLL